MKNSVVRKRRKHRPAKGHNLAIAEWPTGRGPVDYALFVGERLVGVIEAKAEHKDVPAVLDGQARDEGQAAAQLAAEPYDELTDPQGLHLRPYQLAAIRAAEAAVADGQRAILLAMATGTGKTRTVLGLIYRFLKTGRFHRILFLVDRTVLGGQAEDTFREVRLAGLHSLTQIYNVQGLTAPAALERETRVQVATVQSMVRRILYPEDSDSMPAVTDFDLVIVDEAHRGYLLDQELTDEEALYRDQRDYMSKYRSVVEYFAAVRIGLTATPALHTTEIFGAPVYTYSYREAVIDGYLVDHNAPIRIEMALSRQGIHYDAGDTAVLLDPDTGELVNGAQLADELDFELGDFNRTVITESFNRVVLKEIAKHFDPTAREQGKMLIFAASDQHADLIVRLLRECYAGLVPPEAIRKITGSIENGNQKKIREAVLRFKNEQYPSIVVTVDLLTTGVDVPEITTLVFLRRVKSRILFEQMLGRATRLCPSIQKEAFTIYDAVGTYDILSSVSSMKPVAAQPQDAVAKLLDGVRVLLDEAQARGNADESHPLKAAVERATARLQRKAKLLTHAQSRELAASLPALAAQGETTDPTAPQPSAGQKAAKAAATQTTDQQPRTFGAYLTQLRTLPPAQAAAVLLAQRSQLEPLEQLRSPRQRIVVDQHADEVTAVTRGYGAGQYFTPRVLINVMTQLIAPQPGERCNDPACGTFGFMIAADQYVRRATDDYGTLTQEEAAFQSREAFSGCELVHDTHRLALMNAMLHGIGGEIALGDMLSNFGKQFHDYDVVLTNPPFGTKKGGERATRDDFTFQTSNKQLNFLQHIYRSLKRDGHARAAVVLPDNVLFAEGDGTAIRRDLMAKCRLHTILRLPTGIFYAQGVKTNVLFFTRGTQDQDNTDTVWYYDLRTNMPSFGKTHPLRAEDFAGFIAAYTAPDRAVVQDERWHSYTRAEIAAKGDSLDLGLIRDDSLPDYADLPDPAESAQASVALLMEAVGLLQEVADELTQDKLTKSGKSLQVEAQQAYTLKQLQDVCESIFDGDHMPPPKAAEGVPFLVIANVNTGKLNFADTRFVAQAYYDGLSDTRKPQYGDVLYTLVGSYGIPVLVDTDKPFCFQRHMGLLRPKAEQIDSRYLWYVLQTQEVFRQATSIAKGTAQLTVPIKGFRQLRIPVPPLPEQRAIVQRLDQLLAREARAAACVTTAQAELRRLRAAIFSRAYRGEL